MALVGNISGSSQSSSVIGVSGSVIVANRPTATFPSLPGTNVSFFVSGSANTLSDVSVFGGDLVVSGSFIGFGDTMELTGTLSVTNGISGSLTKLTDGTSYLIAGSGISIVSGANGAVTITNDGTVGDITSVTAGTGLTGGGSSGAVTLSINDAVVATVSGTTFTGVTSHNAGLSGSLTQLTDGTSYLIAGSNISITSQSNGAVTISATSAATDDFFDSTTAGSIFTTGSVAFKGSEPSIDSPLDKGTDVFFYVSGSLDGANRSLFGGDLVVSGNLDVKGNTTLGDASGDTVAFNGQINTNVLPSADNTYNLGSATNRWANIYTGDLHLRNDRGNWTLIEEETYLSIRNNVTGKLYKLAMEPIEE